jgi:hypothetical protein
MRLFLRFAAVVATLVLCACSHDSPSEPASVPNLVTNGSFSATIEGTGWSGVGNVSVVKREGNVTVTAASPTYTITLNLGQVTTVGDIPLIMTPILGPSASVMDASGTRWSTGAIGVTGLVTLTMLTGSRIAGTFAFAGLSRAGGGASFMHVARGAFDVTY